MFLLWTSCVWNFLLEDTFVLLQDLLDKGILSNTWWSNDNEWFASQRSRVERMEVLFGVNVDIILFWIKISLSYASSSNTYRFVKEHWWQEIIEHFSDFWVRLNVFFMGLNQLIFTDWKVLEYFIVKVNFTQVHSVGLTVFLIFHNYKEFINL